MKICPQCGNAFDDPVEVCPVDRTKLTSVDPNSDHMLGKLLDGRYRLLRKVGEGGMGSIYRAVHTEMSRTCAIKLLTALSPGKDDAIARFKREARNSSRIDNVHAVTIYDFGQADDGMLFLAMEFIDGKPLSRIMSEQRVLPLERVIHLTDQIAEALAAAHAMGIVHRDLKPDNIMVTRKGVEPDFVKVLDFGIAKTVAEEGGDNLTKTGFVLGTPVYMSPEQLLGENLDPRSDTYSLAIIVYEMLSGRLPFEGDNPQAVMMKRVMSEPIRLRVVAPSVSESVERAVMSGLERDRDSRTPDVQAFASDLRRALHGGTQIMGGIVTGKLTDPAAGRATRDWGNHGTNVDGTGVFTGQLESSPESAVNSNINAWAATEISFPPSNARPLDSLAHETSVPRRGAATKPMEHAEERSHESGIISEPPKRGNKLVWAGSALAIAVVAVILYIIMPFGSSSGFTLIVKGAPPDSTIFINEARRDAVASGGDLKISGLEPGQVSVRVSRQGFTDFITTITGASGEVQNCDAQLLPEIDYSGTMVPIPAGEFVMGDDNHHDDEKPAHTATLPAYYIDKYEVTNAQYKDFCAKTGRALPPNPSFDTNYIAGAPDHPVVGVTIDDAVAYAAWVGKRLPTEEEWEKAASWDSVARQKRQYPWGDDFSSDRANIGSGSTVAVTEGKRDRSPYGVVNMAGNVGEWVNAPYKPYEGNLKPDPDYSKGHWVMRGGTFLVASKPESARTTRRNLLPRAFPHGLSAPIGIRCVVPADDPRIQPLVRARTK